MRLCRRQLISLLFNRAALVLLHLLLLEERSVEFLVLLLIRLQAHIGGPRRWLLAEVTSLLVGQRDAGGLPNQIHLVQHQLLVEHLVLSL